MNLNGTIHEYNMYNRWTDSTPHTSDTYKAFIQLINRNI